MLFEKHPNVVIKEFNFYDVAEAAVLARRKIPEKLIADHMDPFYAECRAYGRIEEKRLNGKVAVRCHGFTSVPAELEDYISEAFGVQDWNRPPEEYKLLDTQRQPFRAVVKDIVRVEVAFTKAMVRMMKADLFALRKILIFVRDLREDNYLGGKLIDFSVSWTSPHLMLTTELRSPEVIDRNLLSELYDFDAMIRNKGIKTRIRAAPRMNEQDGESPRRSKRVKPASRPHASPHPDVAVALTTQKRRSGGIQKRKSAPRKPRTQLSGSPD